MERGPGRIKEKHRVLRVYAWQRYFGAVKLPDPPGSGSFFYANLKPILFRPVTALSIVCSCTIYGTDNDLPPELTNTKPTTTATLNRPSRSSRERQDPKKARRFP